MTKAERLQQQRAFMAFAFIEWALNTGYDSVKENESLKIILNEQICQIKKLFDEEW